MPILKSGAIILGVYASKIRRTLFAQLKDKIKTGEIQGQEIARAAGELNKILYILFIEKLKLEKGDVVRIAIDYDLEGQKIKWNWGNLKVECYRKVSSEEINKNLLDVLKTQQKSEYSVRRLRETNLGDVIFEVLKNDAVVGLIVVTQINGEAILRGAIEPNIILQKMRIVFEGDVENYLAINFEDVLKMGKESTEDDVRKILEEISSL